MLSFETNSCADTELSKKLILDLITLHFNITLSLKHLIEIFLIPNKYLEMRETLMMYFQFFYKLAEKE